MPTKTLIILVCWHPLRQKLEYQVETDGLIDIKY